MYISGKRPIHKDQLDQVCEWTTQFRRETLQPNEIVVFDVLGGDLNLDNSSPGKHASKVLNKYVAHFSATPYLPNW